MSVPPTNIAVAVFARTPVAGAAKTRLIPLLGAEGAAQLQAQLTRLALARARAVAPDRTTLWLAGERAELRDAPGVPVHAQCGGDLGARMAQAFEALLPQHDAVLLIGTDCPAQTVDDLRDAARALHAFDLVLQPAEDGGYVLIGFAQRVLAQTPRWPTVFEGIAWGTENVLAQTRARVADAGMRVAMLNARPDLDLPRDYTIAVAAGNIAPVSAPRALRDGI
jgi:rSAM/selenodomain-associated transferase 1